jgi:two-component system alkaline phosphatase synthesis response regulator PhoP
MSPKQKPLVVIIEDERGLAALLTEQLETAGFVTQVFHKGATALKFIGENHVHLVLLNPALPDVDGWELLQSIRRMTLGPAVIFLSGLKLPGQAARALDLGADDFVAKPHDQDELIARIHAVLRRSETAGDSRLTRNADLATGVFLFNGAEVHPERLELVFGPNKKCKLGRKELGILYHLHANPGVIISRHSLIHAVWGVHADVRSRSLDQYIAKIRDAFAGFGRDLDCFRTIHGIGYWYEPAPAAERDGKKSRRA